MNNKEFIENVDYTIKDGVLRIRQNAVYIPNECFSGLCEKVKINEIILPPTLVFIGSRAFSRCGNIDKIVIPDNVKYIMNEAFAYCSINTLIIGKNTKYIGDFAFAYNNFSKVENNSKCLRLMCYGSFCSNRKLKAFDFGKSTNIFVDEQAFFNTPYDIEYKDDLGLTNVIPFDMDHTYNRYSEYYPENVCCFETVDKYTYENGVLKINDGIEIIGSFQGLIGCTSVEMPDSVLIIQGEAFLYLSLIENVKFSSNLLVIGANAFDSEKLRSSNIVLPESLAYMKLSSFNQYDEEYKVHIPNTTYVSDDLTYTEIEEIYERYRNSFLIIDSRDICVLNIDELLESERTILNNLGLLPDNIDSNKKINNTFSSSKIDIIEEAFLEFLYNSEYDENNDIKFIIKILELKEIDISNMHLVVNSLFERKQIKTIYLLISYGYDYTNNSLISRAIMNGMSEMIDILLLLGANINEINTIDKTPLSLACGRGDYKLVEHLIEKGAAINMVDKSNKKAIDYATENNYEDIVNLINSFDREISDTEKDLESLKMQLRMGE